MCTPSIVMQIKAQYNDEDSMGSVLRTVNRKCEQTMRKNKKKIHFIFTIEHLQNTRKSVMVTNTKRSRKQKKFCTMKR